MTTTLPRPLDLPEFPWDQLAPAKARAAAHPGGICDLSVGTPVDDTPAFIRDALAEASNAHGYPTVIGTAEVRDAILAWGARRGMVDVGPGGVIPTIGSKEAVAWLPFLLGVRPGDTVRFPRLPTRPTTSAPAWLERLPSPSTRRTPTRGPRPPSST